MMRPEPHVGIFWAVPIADGEQLVTQGSSLPGAERYGDNLTHPHGHYETWSAWQAIGTAALARRGLPAAIAWHEYDDLPRGRVVFSVPDRWFTVYADTRLHTPMLRAAVMAAFALPARRTRLLTDAHYRTTSLQGEAA